MLYIIYILFIILNNNNQTEYEWGGALDQINWPTNIEK